MTRNPDGRFAPGKGIHLIPAGERFGRWTVVGLHDVSHGNARFVCRCDCGNLGTPFGMLLRSGGSRSCGCLSAITIAAKCRARALENYIPEPNTGCWLWCGRIVQGSGYGVTRAGGGGGAHRFFWEAHRGPIPAGLFVCHHCDTPACVNPEHLFLGTPKDNHDDKVRKGRAPWQKKAEWVPRGEQLGNAKLTAETVRAIRRSATPSAELARQLGVSDSCVEHARAGRNWRHVS